MDAIMVGENAAAKLIESNRIAARFIFRCLYLLKKKNAQAHRQIWHCQCSQEEEGTNADPDQDPEPGDPAE
jgi:hypothetical protein